MKLNETCPVCQVRFERWNGSWTIAAVMGYTSGALFAIVLGAWFLHNDMLKGSEKIIIPLTVLFSIVRLLPKVIIPSYLAFLSLD